MLDIMFIILFRFDNLAATTSYIEYPFLGKYSIISDNIYNINVKHINIIPLAYNSEFILLC